MGRSHWILASSLLTLVIVMIWSFYPSGYGKVEPESYRAAQAIYAASLEHDLARVGMVETRLNAEDLRIPDQEKQWLLEMVDEAKSGNWASAIRNSRTMLKDQTDRR